MQCQVTRSGEVENCSRMESVQAIADTQERFVSHCCFQKRSAVMRHTRVRVDVDGSGEARIRLMRDLEELQRM